MNSSVGQSRTMSLVEAMANVVAGFLLALMTQMAIFPAFGLAVSVIDNLLIGSIFTAVSLVRSFALRRVSRVSGLGQEKLNWSLPGKPDTEPTSQNDRI